MSDAPEKDQKTEAPTDKRRRDAAKKGDVLQSKELGVALVTLAGAAWLVAAGHMLVGSMEACWPKG
jgi:flagellar biosynthetic protein FlhB